MGVKPVVRPCDELFVEPRLAAAGFIAREKENGLTLRVEGKSHAPFAVRRTETQFLHIRVTGIVQRIDARPSQLRPESLEEPGMGKNLGTHGRRQFLELWFKLVTDFNIPSHRLIMTWNTYVVKIILARCPARESDRGAIVLK